MTEKLKPYVEIYSDGACRGNPGPGGWGAVVRTGGSDNDIFGFKKHTTNNEMELKGAIEGLKSITESSSVTLFTDSKYLVNGMKSWIHGWKKNNWRTAAKKPVKNKELWQALDIESKRHDVTWEWVKGHDGHPENERADALANHAIDVN